jgi:hypothetical protein
MKVKSIISHWRYARGGGIAPKDAATSMLASLKWLCAAQDTCGGGGGISRAYSLGSGWELPYPETTGYIIPTFLLLHSRFPELALQERAWRAGKWLAAVQFESGAICSKQHRPGNTKPSIFNTGMVLHGWVSLLEQKHDEEIHEAAAKAVKWLIEEQEQDGSWKRNAFNGLAHTYYTMVDWALVRYALLLKDEKAKSAAMKNLDWTLSQQRDNGWFERCWFSEGDPVTSHTLSYTTQGLVESGRLLAEPRYIEAARKGTDPFLELFQKTGKVPGTFKGDWSPTSSWECCTGNAQTSLVWQALAVTTKNEIWSSAAKQLNQHMLGYQRIQCRNSGISGAIPGSWPISGDYDRFNFPNHAAKFHIDALAAEVGVSLWP